MTLDSPVFRLQMCATTPTGPQTHENLKLYQQASEEQLSPLVTILNPILFHFELTCIVTGKSLQDRFTSNIGCCSLLAHSSTCAEELCRIYRDSRHCGWNLPSLRRHLKHPAAKVSRQKSPDFPSEPAFVGFLLALVGSPRKPKDGLHEAAWQS